MKQLTFKERQIMTKAFAQRYQQATKKQKTLILNQFCSSTGYARAYASFLLHNWGRKVKLTIKGVRTIYEFGTSKKKRTKRYRPRLYDERVDKVLKQLWYIADGICGKRLAQFIRDTLHTLERFEEITVDYETRSKLLTISPATIDRHMASERKKSQLKGRSTTKPGTLLKHQIPIRTFSQWDEKKPGFVEIDLVSHEGGFFEGDNIYTLDVTDICTTWTETRAIKNKAQRWTFDALQHIITNLPFTLLGIDSDNGSEFINYHLLRYCLQHKLTFTRSREYRKNDNCFVEQKNFSIVRRTVGYYRYDTDEELQLLNNIYDILRLYTNFFLPTMRLKEKSRIGSKVKRLYDKPITPFKRVLQHPTVSKVVKKKLKYLYQTLNPAQLKRDLIKLQNRLFSIAESKSKYIDRKQKHFLSLPIDEHYAYLPFGSLTDHVHQDI
ncbi:MAG: DDE-type integrase/transposase/recombinase [Ignavibacteriales bacterium]|nr:DDE-type integrase/transposase/recombinase [Ignavibacteriales bacterium]